MGRLPFDGQPHYVWNTTHISALISTLFSFIGEFYVFYKTYKISRKGRLDFSHKLPASISLCDFVFNFHHGLDHLLSISTHRVSGGALCTWLGFGSLVGLQAMALWSLVLALYMSSLIIFDLRLGFDRRFLVVAAFCWGPPLVANTVAASLGKIGDAGMFCMINDRLTLVIMKPVLFLTVFFFIALCYIAIGIKLARHVYRHYHILSQASNTEELSSGFRSNISQLQRVGLRLFGFTVVYIIQFTPVCILVFTTVSGQKPSLVLHVFDKVLANGNGWMNAIAYRHFLKKSEEATESIPESAREPMVEIRREVVSGVEGDEASLREGTTCESVDKVGSRQV